MKGKIIRQEVSASIIDYIHGVTYWVTRIWLPEANNLVIIPDDGELFVYRHDFKDSEYEATGETEVPDNLVREAHIFLQAKEEFYKLRPLFKAIIERDSNTEK
jgi:hypothetical protein